MEWWEVTWPRLWLTLLKELERCRQHWHYRKWLVISALELAKSVRSRRARDRISQGLRLRLERQSLCYLWFFLIQRANRFQHRHVDRVCEWWRHRSRHYCCRGSCRRVSCQDGGVWPVWLTVFEWPVCFCRRQAVHLTKCTCEWTLVTVSTTRFHIQTLRFAHTLYCLLITPISISSITRLVFVITPQRTCSGNGIFEYVCM
jgi:hypothetical protein